MAGVKALYGAAKGHPQQTSNFGSVARSRALEHGLSLTDIPHSVDYVIKYEVPAEG